MPVETFKERMELIPARYGTDLEFYGYNREDLGDRGMPPLNTPARSSMAQARDRCHQA